MTLFREDYYHRDDPAWIPTHEVEVAVIKQNDLPTGMVKLRFEGECLRFTELSAKGTEG